MNIKIALLIIVFMLFFGISVSKPIPISYAFDGNVSDTSDNIETPLPPYAFLYHGENLTIDISSQSPLYPNYGEGLSKDSTYTFDDVMFVENNVTKTGADVICVIVTSQMTGLKFYYLDNKPSESIAITLGANEIMNIGMQINTTNFNIGNASGTIKIQAFEGACE